MKKKAMFARKNGEPFAQGMGFYKLFWIFLIGCFVGVIVEMLWCLLTRHTLESRKGLIYGPFNPVYGLGAVLITVCLCKLSKRRDLWIFLGSMVLGGVFEYACSLFQELVFGTVSWEYSGTFLSVNGRTSLVYCMFWGVLGVVWVKDVMPLLSRWIEKIPRKVGVVLSWAFIIFFVFDIAVSSAAVIRRTERSKGNLADNHVEQFLDKHYPNEFLECIYPNMIIR